MLPEGASAGSTGDDAMRQGRPDPRQLGEFRPTGAVDIDAKPHLASHRSIDFHQPATEAAVEHPRGGQGDQRQDDQAGDCRLVGAAQNSANFHDKARTGCGQGRGSLAFALVVGGARFRRGVWGCFFVSAGFSPDLRGSLARASNPVTFWWDSMAWRKACCVWT